MLKDRFLDYLKFEKRFSPNTLISYELDLAQFTAYIQSQYNINDPSEADHQMIRSWVVDLLEQDISPRSVNRKLSSLKSFYRFCLRTESLKVNPMIKVSGPKIAKHLPVFVEKERIDKLFSQIPVEDTFESLRDRLIVMMLYATGMRRSELLGLQLADIDMAKNTLKVLGKRSKERIIPIGDYLSREIAIYLMKRGEKGNGDKRESTSEGTHEQRISGLNIDNSIGQNNHELLFVTTSGKKMNARQVYTIVHQALAQVSSQSKLSPHILRHSFATHLLNDGADLNAIKEILGHTSLAATQVYTHNTIEKLKKIHNQAHPRA